MKDLNTSHNADLNKKKIKEHRLVHSNIMIIGSIYSENVYLTMLQQMFCVALKTSLPVTGNATPSLLRGIC